MTRRCAASLGVLTKCAGRAYAPPCDSSRPAHATQPPPRGDTRGPAARVRVPGRPPKSIGCFDSIIAPRVLPRQGWRWGGDASRWRRECQRGLHALRPGGHWGPRGAKTRGSKSPGRRGARALRRHPGRSTRPDGPSSRGYLSSRASPRPDPRPDPPADLLLPHLIGRGTNACFASPRLSSSHLVASSTHIPAREWTSTWTVHNRDRLMDALKNFLKSILLICAVAYTGACRTSAASLEPPIHSPANPKADQAPLPELPTALSGQLPSAEGEEPSGPSSHRGQGEASMHGGHGHAH